jgi:hypothetical protein
VSLAAILDQMADTLETAFDGSDLDIQVVPRMNFNPTPLSVDMFPGDPFRDPDTAGMGDESGALLFTVRARVSTADFEAGQDVLLALMDDTDDLSVATALMDDYTLNGLASSVYVTGPSGFVRFDDGSGKGALLGVQWGVTILAVNS